MLTVSLGSGSAGNCIFIKSGKTSILLDAGLSGRVFDERLGQIDEDASSIQAVFLTHEHIDHCGGVGVLNRRYGFPVYTTEETFEASQKKCGVINPLHFFRAGETIQIDNLKIQSIPSIHDCANGVHFIVDDGQCRLGYFTDLGGPSDLVHAVLSTLDIIYLESNYDPRMMKACSYPESVKKRITGGKGHLSNLESAQMIRYYASADLKHLVLSHISDNANTYTLAKFTHKRLHKGGYQIHAAPRDDIGPILEIAEKLEEKLLAP